MAATKFKYKNITISGLPGCGSTTLLNMLKEELKLAGWRGFSGGEFMRAYAVEKGLFDDKDKIHHAATAYSNDFDRQVDMGMRQKLQSQSKWIIESWLSGFMAQGLTGVLKVLMTCSADAVRIDRIVNRDEITVAEAKKHIQDRYQTNLTKWQQMYHQEWQQWVVQAGKAKAEDPIDFWRPDLYDVVIDTFSHNQQQTVEIVLEQIYGYKKSAQASLKQDQ
ncbi:MAG: AAA family ATPase [Candidatus Pacebacteria bacterium]|nr:AAA family ATPase [Candidatus Paceibacterota bacterium]